MARVSTVGNVTVLGADELARQFARIEKMPKKYLTRSAKAGSKPILTEARAKAPVGKGTETSGTLKKSLRLKQETPNKRNKAVYRLRYDPKYTTSFLKPTTGVYGGKTPFAYYPASVEYGFKTAVGKTEGSHLFSKIVASHEKRSFETVVRELNKAIDEILRGAN
jgi:hypothetical protein